MMLTAQGPSAILKQYQLVLHTSVEEAEKARVFRSQSECPRGSAPSALSRWWSRCLLEPEAADQGVLPRDQGSVRESPRVSEPRSPGRR